MAKKQVADGSPSLDLKRSQAAYDFGVSIVETEQRHEITVRDMLLQCMSYTVKEIGQVEIGIRDVYGTMLISISDKAGVADVSKLKSQVYARQSEKLAALECFTLMHSRPAEEQREYRLVLEGAKGYHNMVSQCRTIAGLITAIADGKEYIPGDAKKETERGKGFVKIKTTIAKVRVTKDVEILIQLRDACNSRIALLQPKQAEVIPIAKARKARKALTDKAAQAFKAVNKVRKARKQAVA